MYRNAEADTQVEVFEEGAFNFLDPQKAFIESCSSSLPYRPTDQPFCLCVTFNLPHSHSTDSMEMRPEDDALYKSAYRDQRMSLPETYRDYNTALNNPKLPRYVYSGKQITSYDYVKTGLRMKDRLVRYCQTITGMDRMVGRLREKLEALGLADNTMIVFSTDHGIHHGEHGLGGKCLLYEEDVRIPLILYDPRLEEKGRGQVREEFVLVPDLAPTMLEMADVVVPETMQGESLLPLLRGETVQWREDFFSEQLMDIQDYPRSESVRNREWKYIRYFKRSSDPEMPIGAGTFGTKENYLDCLTSTLTDELPIYEELYHLKEDPGEIRNLAMDPAYTSVLGAMRNRILKLGREAKGGDGDPLTLPL